MAIISLKDAFDYGFVKTAICSFNFVNVEQLYGIVAAADELQTPVVLMISQKTALKYGLEVMFNLAKSKAEKLHTPFVIHLDHAKNIELVEKAINLGFSSVMFDGSSLSFDENIKKTYEVVKKAHRYGITVEGEINAIYGKEEDGPTSAIVYTKVEDAKKFSEETEVDFLAVSVGTKHGLYEGTPSLRYDLINEISNSIKSKLVMHGCSGLTAEQLRKSIQSGIKKLNFGTEVMLTQINAIKKSLENLSKPDIRPIMDSSIDEIKAYVKNTINSISISQ
ncbi:class II fructose-bisphosphate aldolase [Caldicellulosiruptor acetigenus]|uniref:class II fructose-bisphosphate aldolase n=1 Tax=Caldicellulosiruptor acetigenus TaxID=301953 RepID=UPI000412D71D|nr:class II fructose-bisphosphate aldolase [Caldicellulosiruptor acetigenus]WAM36848.1 class II fructose-bisphosphate aldolase [Caldicellulosiruptor acetigenus]